ncbi:MAG TPA: hypothetical protein VMA36_17515 [Candidatus Limnocylindria bacterium]|jgi:hypothetical protein|nr:hypothetical protein [Candidatus Limnocylindria bacterium]
MMGAAGEGLVIGSAEGHLIFDDLVVSIGAVLSDARGIEVLVSEGRTNPRPSVVDGGTFRVTVDDDPKAIAQLVMNVLTLRVEPSKRKRKPHDG